MANVKITDLPSLTGVNSASTDVIPVVDISADTTSKMTRAEFFLNVPAITTTGSVGIGTTTPATKLHLSDTVPVYITMIDQGDGAGRIGQNGTALTFGVDGVNGATERMRITNTGNVGIGTTSPSVKLDVVGSGVFTSNSDILTLKYASDVGSARLAWKNVAGTTLWDIVGGMVIRQDEFAIRRAGTSVIYLDNANNVGIGTTSPAVKLHVVSSTGGILESLRLQNDSTFATSGRGTQISFRGTSGGLLGTITASTSTTADDQGSLNYSANGATSFHRFDTNSAERMRIDASGNVGIGTSTAPYKLTVQSTGSGVGFQRNIVQRAGTQTDYHRTSIVYNDSGTVTGAFAGYSSGIYHEAGGGFGAGGGLTFATNALAGPITFATSDTERMRIDASGNVGIGNTAPVAKLHVTGASITTGVVYKAQPAQTSKAAAATLTIAELLTGIVQYTGAAATLTLPTGTSIEGGLPATFPTDMSFDVSFINTGAGLLTIGANGNTTVGTMTVATLTSAMLRFRKTATNTYTVYRIS